MRGLLRRRPVRHLAIGIALLLLAGLALLVVLTNRFGTAAAPVRAATATAPATVVRGQLGPDGKGVQLNWTDARGEQHLSEVRLPEVASVQAGASVQVHYLPDDPSRVYVAGDEFSVRARDLAFDILAVLVVLVAALLLSGVHLARRLRAERRPATTMPVTYARCKRGLMQRSWLVLDDAGREWWVPVHWVPALGTLLAKTPAAVHGRLATDRVLVVDVGGTPIWQSGRRRSAPPTGEMVTAATPWSKSAQREAEAAAAAADAPPPAGLARQLRGDGVLVVVAPLLGLLWAYLDSSGPGGFVGATVLMVGVLLWLPAMLGTDPT
jgi:hypothetical protein